LKAAEFREEDTEKERERELRIVMSGGTADFFYREARRLKFVARSAFKVAGFCRITLLLKKSHSQLL
jgi:hypothetical protein